MTVISNNGSSNSIWYNYDGTVYELSTSDYDALVEAGLNKGAIDDEDLKNTLDGIGTVITYEELLAAGYSEDELAELDIDDDIDAVSSAAPTADSYETSEEVSSGYPEGYDYESSTAYNESIGLSALTEDSSIDDYIAVFEQIEEQVNELESKIASVDEDDPEALEELFADMTNMTVAIADLASATDTELPKEGVWSKVGIGVAASTSVVGLCVGTQLLVGATTTAISTVTTVAATSALVPVAGWVVAAAILVGAGIWAGVSAYKNHQAQKQLEQLQEDIQATAETLNGAWDDASEKLQDGASAVIDEVEEDLDGLLEDEFSFDDVTDVDSILDNIDKIIDAQAKLEPYYTVASTYGIEIEGLDELMEKLGTGDDSLQYAQSYLDAYADQVSLNITDEVITDTETLNALYEDIEELITNASERGLDTSKLEDLLETITETNQEEADETASDISSSGTSSNTSSGTSSSGTSSSGTSSGTSSSSGDDTVSTVTTAAEASEEASTTANKVKSASTSYDTDTSSLDETSEELIEYAQTTIDNYVASISTDGLTIEELETLYNSVYAVYTQLSGVEGVDYSGITSKLTEIRTAQQTLIDELASECSSAVSSASTTSEMVTILSKINAYISQYSSYSVDISALSSLAQEIITTEQNKISEKAAYYIAECNSCTTEEEINSVTLNVQTDIQYAQNMGLDVSAYKEVLKLLYQKLEEIQNNESNTEIDNGVTDNSTTDNSVTDNSVTNVDNSVTNNIEINQSSDVDTSTIEEILQKILDKLNEEKEEDEETIEKTEEEETVTETDNEEETEIEDDETCEDEDNVIPDTDNLNVDITVESDSEEETASETDTETQETAETSSSIIIEGEDGYDYELDFEEDE